MFTQYSKEFDVWGIYKLVQKTEKLRRNVSQRNRQKKQLSAKCTSCTTKGGNQNENL